MSVLWPSMIMVATDRGRVIVEIEAALKAWLERTENTTTSMETKIEYSDSGHTENL